MRGRGKEEATGLGTLIVTGASRGIGAAVAVLAVERENFTFCFSAEKKAASSR